MWLQVPCTKSKEFYSSLFYGDETHLNNYHRQPFYVSPITAMFGLAPSNNVYYVMTLESMGCFSILCTEFALY